MFVGTGARVLFGERGFFIIKMRVNIPIVYMIKDEEDRILLLKIVKGNETITVGSIYDDNRNTTRILTKLEELLDKIDARQGVVIGGDYNVIVNPLLDQYFSLV